MVGEITMNYRISWDKLTKDDNGNFVNKKYKIIVRSTKREVDEMIDEMTTNLLYSNILLEKEDDNNVK